MNSRRVMIKFNLEEYDTFDIGEILQCLPDYTHIVSIHKNVYNSSLNTVMVIENEIFKEVKEGQEYPEVNILFDKDDYQFDIDCSDIIEIKPQEKCLNSLYISDVDKENKIINFSFVPILDYPLAYLGEWKTKEELLSQYPQPTNVTGKIEKRMGYDAAIGLILNICNHSWKSYQGFSENYEYCEKCDEKK